jgi:hypothetical protein
MGPQTDLQGVRMTFILCHEWMKGTSIEKQGKAFYESSFSSDFDRLSTFKDIINLTTFYTILNANKLESH